jgi:hypothetical protein
MNTTYDTTNQNKASTLIDRIPERYGRLTVVERAQNDRQGKTQWRCACDCGREVVARPYSLKIGETKSCGCLSREMTISRSYKHGHARGGRETSVYASWKSMIRRCYNPNDQDYKSYGAKGRAVCKRWRNSFENFLTDMPGWFKGAHLHRIDNLRGYGELHVARPGIPYAMA